MSKILVLAALCLPMATAQDPTSRPRSYGAIHADMMSAYRSSQWKPFLTHINEGLALRPQYPPLVWNRAIGLAKLERLTEAIDLLKLLVKQGIAYPPDADLVNLEKHPGFAAVKRGLAANKKPVGTPNVVARGKSGSFVPEGIAYLPKARAHLLGSITQRSIVRIDASGKETVLVAPGAGGLYSAFAFDPDEEGGFVDVASSAVEQTVGIEHAARGRAGIFRYSLENGRLLSRHQLPSGRAHILGDLVRVGNSIFATDSITGALWHLERELGHFRQVVHPGRFLSLQGITTSEDGRLYVADYRGGISLIDPKTGAVTAVTKPDDICLYGIDGMRRSGRYLLCVQNGISPHRVIRLELDDKGQKILSARVLVASHPEFDEPTQGVIAGDAFHFVANSHWNRFGPDGVLASGPWSPPLVLSIPFKPTTR